MKIRKCFLRPVVSSRSKHRISSTHPYFTLFYFGTLGAEVFFWHGFSHLSIRSSCFSVAELVNYATNKRREQLCKCQNHARKKPLRAEYVLADIE